MKASARIEVTLYVPIADTWLEPVAGQVAEVRHQAIEAGLKRLQQVLDGAGGGLSGVRVIGEPRVTIVLDQEL